MAIMSSKVQDGFVRMESTYSCVVLIEMDISVTLLGVIIA